jgi:hypothetical protein
MKCGQQRKAARVRPAIRSSAKNALARSTGTAARALCEGLESRVMLSRVRPIDAGEVYWDTFNRVNVPLLRATDEVVLGLSPSSARRMRRLTAAIVSEKGALAGYQLTQKLNQTTFIFRRTARGFAPDYDILARKVQGFPTLKYLSPSYIQLDQNGRNDGRIVATDEIDVDLRDDVDPAAFFARGYSGYRPAPLGTNAYIATLRHGGGIDAVRVSSTLMMHRLVEYAVPNVGLEVTPSSVPNDALYSHQWNMGMADLPAAWDKTTGSAGVVIAILDNGVQENHPDLAANIFVNGDEIPNNSTEDDGNGCQRGGGAAERGAVTLFHYGE